MKIHPTAIISSKASIGKNVEIGPFTIIHDNVEIGDGSTVGSHCELGHPTALAERDSLIIGRGSLIRSHSVFYQGSIFGPNLVTGHHVCVRENTKAGNNLQIGTLSDIQGSCEIGDYTRFHSYVNIGRLSKIGDFVWIFPFVALTNDPHPPSNYLVGCAIGSYTAVATMTVILPGVTVGEHCLIAAHSLVKNDVNPGMVAAGSPATEICPASKIKLRDGTGRPAYPWTTHFHRGYPEHVVSQWLDMAASEVPQNGRIGGG